MILNYRDKSNATTTRMRLQAQLDSLRRRRWRDPLEFMLASELLEKKISELSARIDEFSELERQSITVAEPIRLNQIPEYLIKRRIRCGVSQAELARRLGFCRNAILIYEKSRYAGVSLGRILQIDAAIRELESTREFEISFLLEQEQNSAGF